MNELRLIPFARASGPTNMARDEAVMEAVAAGNAPPTLRLYGWLGDWLSIGLAQRIADVDRQAATAAGVQLVRRSSGGTAVLHRDQIGWSVSLPAGHRLAPADIVESYRRHGEIARLFCAKLGVAGEAVSPEQARAPLADPALAAACFGSLAPYEIVVDGARKLIGWGQVRRRGIVMHHAVLSRRFDASALVALLNTDRTRLADLLAARITGLDEAAGRRPAAREIEAALIAAFDAAGYPATADRLSESELRRAADISRRMYGTESWTARR
jgi:lipoate-protein ligase A